MKTRTFFIGFLLVLFISCKDDYYDFSDDEKKFINYNEGDTFIILNNNSNDTLFFKITKREDTYNYGGTNLINKTFHQAVNLFFETETNETGHLFYYKEKDRTVCDINISKNATPIFMCFSARTDNVIEFIRIKDTMDQNVFYFMENGETKSDSLFYTKEKGILKFSNSETGEVFTLIDK
jgi:hypothetical protein